MRRKTIENLRKKNLKKNLSCFELEEFADEIKEYKSILNCIGMDLELEREKHKIEEIKDLSIVNNNSNTKLETEIKKEEIN